jgi:hypothetical protein
MRRARRVLPHGQKRRPQGALRRRGNTIGARSARRGAGRRRGCGGTLTVDGITVQGFASDAVFGLGLGRCGAVALLAEAAARCDCQELRRPETFGAQQVSPVGTVLDFPAHTLPVLLERVVPHDQRLELEAPPRVADLLAAEDVDAPIHVFARDHGLDLFEAEEVLLVQRAQTLEAHFQFIQGSVELFDLHGDQSIRGRISVGSANGRSNSVEKGGGGSASKTGSQSKGTISRLSKQTGVSQSLKAKCS